MGFYEFSCFLLQNSRSKALKRKMRKVDFGKKERVGLFAVMQVGGFQKAA